MVVDSVQDINNFIGTKVFLYPILKDWRVHDYANTIIGFVLIDIDTRAIITISNGHPEGIYNNSSLNFLKERKVYCHNALTMKYAGYDTSEYVDNQMQYYLYTNQGYKQDVPSLINHYTRQFSSCYRIGELIPLLKHEEFAMQAFEESWIQKDQPGLEFYEHNLIDAFLGVEINGVKINSQKFQARFGDTLSKIGDYCYTQYNYYTTTGRPSNRFGGINYAALTKDDDTRESFISRHEGGCLIELDFNSYHPRLISQLIGYDFGDDNVYEHLARHYYNTDNPTAEEIDSAKELTFRQIYGGIQQQYLNIPFFYKTNEMANYLWRLFNDEGYIESPLSGRRLIIGNYQDISCYTLFNYFIQMYETETNVMILNNIHNKLKNYKTKPVLYTYDSILFDVEQAELDSLIKEVIPQCIDLQKFPIKIKKGTTYKNLNVWS
jgi:hypothetical protein